MLNKMVILSLFVLSCSYDAVQSSEWCGAADWALFNVPERRAMWVWNPAAVDGDNNANRNWDGYRNARDRFFENYKGVQDMFLDFCENKSIRVLYFFGFTWEWSQSELNNGNIVYESGFAAFNARARARGIQVWLMYYLWDDPDDPRMMDDLESVKLIAQAVHNFNRAYPASAFAGIHCDQEPGDTTVYPALLDNMKNAADWIQANQVDLLLSQALRPKWLKADHQVTWNGSHTLMNYHMMDIIDHGVLMCYDDRYNVMIRWSNQILDYATGIGKKVAIGTELNRHGDSDTVESWYHEIQAEPIETRFLTDLVNPPTTYEDAMHQLVEDLNAKPGFDRMAIHSYKGYFDHWFGAMPRDYLLALPGGEYDSAAANPPEVDLNQDNRPLFGPAPEPGCNEFPMADFNLDCRVDSLDFSIMSRQWLADFDHDVDVSGPSGMPDSEIDLYDFAELALEWLACYLEPHSDCL